MTEVEDVYKLTPMQAGLLFHSLTEPEPGIYVVQMRFEIAGRLDVTSLRAAWRATARRHAALRTALVWNDIPRPVQAVLPEVEIPFVGHDMSDVAREEQPSRVTEILYADRARGFDLAEAPLMRVILIRLGEEQHEMVWSHHHVVLDGWSTSVIVDEVVGRYRQITEGELAPELPPAPAFREYVSWLARRAELVDDAFWRRELAGYRRPVRIDLDRPVSIRETECPWYDRHLEVSDSRLSAWRDGALRYQVTFPTLVQATWAAVLARHDSGAPTEVVYGIVTAVRDYEREGGDRVVGLCVNNLPMRVNVARDQTCEAWLRQIQQTQARMAEADAVDVGRFREWSEGPPSEPLFRYILAIENYPQRTLAADAWTGGLRVRYLGVHEATNYVLTAGVPAGERPRLKLTADARAVSPADVDRLLAEWAVMLDRLAAAGCRVVGDLIAPRGGAAPTLVTPVPEVPESVVDSSDTLVDRFAAQAARRPQALAVTCGDVTLTYAELDQRSGRLASHLVALGVGPERRVGLVADRSVELVVGILGILRSGGAYVPLDPTYPAARRQFIARDAELDLVVTDRVRELPELTGMNVIPLEVPDVPRSTANMPRPATSQQLAYIIYTSGSTGQPKGVLVEHTNIVALLDATQPYGQFDEGDVWTMCHSYAFDVSVFEMWGALSHGGRLVVVPADTVRAPDTLHALLSAEHVTVFSQTPSAFGQFVAADARSVDGVGEDLRLVLFAGEDLGTINIGPWMRRYGDGGARLVNLYGISETTVHSTWHDVTPGSLSGEQATSRIGASLPGWSVRLLDPQLRPVPGGVTGDLYVGGAGLARGYCGRPGLTAERFVPDPSSPGRRLYRSGDRARRLLDGTLEYVGRADAQVKIRGVRIEPGEVESVLTEHPAVAQCVVAARRFGPDDVRLVAFVVAAGGDGQDGGGKLRRFAQDRLPAAMVPSVFVTVARLPLTPSGKVDRSALRDIEVLVAGQVRGAPPRTRTERLVSAAWCAALGGEKVGIDENFFDVGGHSLLMFGLLQELRDAGWPWLSMVELFANPTVATQARLLDAACASGADSDAASGFENREGRARTAAVRDLRARRGAQRER